MELPGRKHADRAPRVLPDIVDGIDAHHHVWSYTAADYPWIDPSMSALKKDFSERDLELETSRLGISGTVVVQARQTKEETDQLLTMAGDAKQVVGVVGWLPMADPEFPSILEQYADSPNLVGLRHVVQDEPDPEFLLRPVFNAALRALGSTGRAYDILIRESQLAAAISLVAQHPNQRFVLDHMAKPNIAVGSFDRWEAGIRELARHEGVFCKLSGLVTEAHWMSWTEQDLQPYVDVVLDCFGPARLMFGSDWPVCTVAANYDRWYWAARSVTSSCSEAECKQIFRESAIRAYQLEAV